jgi:hypothetical protein
MNTAQLVAIARGWRHRHKEVAKYLRDTQRPIPLNFNNDNKNKEKE